MKRLLTSSVVALVLSTSSALTTACIPEQVVDINQNLVNINQRLISRYESKPYFILESEPPHSNVSAVNKGFNAAPQYITRADQFRVYNYDSSYAVNLLINHDILNFIASQNNTYTVVRIWNAKNETPLNLVDSKITCTYHPKTTSFNDEYWTGVIPIAYKLYMSIGNMHASFSYSLNVNISFRSRAQAITEKLINVALKTNTEATDTALRDSNRIYIDFNEWFEEVNPQIVPKNYIVNFLTLQKWFESNFVNWFLMNEWVKSVDSLCHVIYNPSILQSTVNILNIKQKATDSDDSSLYYATVTFGIGYYAFDDKEHFLTPLPSGSDKPSTDDYISINLYYDMSLD